ncbi:LPS-assembly lipoprotein [Skermanella aerolata]|nr:LPS assembly lipoprotein LptE [Skermanella aerolata]
MNIVRWLMPSFKKFPLAGWGLLLSLTLLPGCGYQPLHGANTPAAQQLPLVQINNIPDRLGQQLRNNLIDKFYRDGRPASPEYTLDISLVPNVYKLGIALDDSATRAELNLVANYTLRNMQGAAVLSGTTTSVTNFNILSSQYATLIGERDAYDRSVVQVSEDITRRVSLFFNRDPVTASAQ